MDELINWILEEGRDSDDLGAICQRDQRTAGRAGNSALPYQSGMPTIDPTAALLRFDWSRDKGLTSTPSRPRIATALKFQRSPIRHLLER